MCCSWEVSPLLTKIVVYPGCVAFVVLIVGQMSLTHRWEDSPFDMLLRT